MEKYELIAILIGYFIGILLGSLIFWGLGELAIYLFKLNYEWYFLHGVLTEFLYIALKNLVRR